LATVNIVGQLAEATVSHCTLTDNQAVGGAGGSGQDGGAGRGGGLVTASGATATVVHCIFTGNQALGGSGGTGGHGGNGVGGGLYTGVSGRVTLVGCLITDNEAVGGTAPGGAAGHGRGGGVYIAMGGTMTADSTTLITGNHASTSNDDVFGDLGGGADARERSLRAEAETLLFAIPGILEEVFGDLGVP
jgi:hypothetical protein